MKKTRIKQPAITVPVPQDAAECAAYIHAVGEMDRAIGALELAMNGEIAEVTERYAGRFTPLKARLLATSAAVQTWCEAHRADLTQNGKVKTAGFVTGSVQWRQRPPSVLVRGADSVIETLKRLGLGRFVRVKEEVNKEAVLNQPEAVAGVAGISLKTGVEDFVITPFAQEAA